LSCLNLFGTFDGMASLLVDKSQRFEVFLRLFQEEKTTTSYECLYEYFYFVSGSKRELDDKE
jgi:hypothetical protein